METESRPSKLREANLRAAIRNTAGKYLDLGKYRVFLFGSQSSGTAVRGSDIDVGILGDEPVPGRTIERIRGDLEALRTLRGFDVVDFFGASEAFRAAALKYAQEL